MSKYIIFNCPAYKGFTKDIPDWLDNTNCGQYTGQVSCQDCTDCIMKQIVELYTEQTQFCEDCSTWTCEDCEFSTNGFAEEVIELIDIQEVE